MNDSWVGLLEPAHHVNDLHQLQLKGLFLALQLTGDIKLQEGKPSRLYGSLVMSILFSSVKTLKSKANKQNKKTDNNIPRLCLSKWICVSLLLEPAQVSLSITEDMTWGGCFFPILAQKQQHNRINTGNSLLLLCSQYVH